MCGICGVINFKDKPVPESAIRKMMQIMKHRGPDDEGVFIEDNIGLGFVRLSIIDLSPSGHQPMFSDDGRYVMIFNGELYNYIEIREELQKKGYHFKTRTDSEVLLISYIEWGETCLNRFNGMWAFIIYDRQLKKFFGARDRYGIKPLYYIHTNDYLAFSSEIPPLLSLLINKPKPNYHTIFDFLVFNRTDQSENTFFEEVKKLQHGHKFTLSKVEMSITKWYDLRKEVALSQGFKNAGEFKKLFSSAVGLRLRSDVPVGVCLSGGLDSSSIVSVLLQDYDKKDLNTFSTVYNKGQLGDESEYVNEYKASLQNMFFTTPDPDSLKNDLTKFVSAHGEPIPSTSPYAQFQVMKLAQGKAVVTLDGQGADEMLAGYHDFFAYYFKGLFFNHRYYKLLTEIFHYFKNHRSSFALKALVFLLLPEKLKTDLRINEKKYLNGNFVKKYKDTSSISENLYGSVSLNDALLNHFDYKLEHLLKWEDRNSMFFSLEARCPFLDYRLVEKSLATSGDLIIMKGMTKYILREAMKGILPERIRLRKDKIGFGTPDNEWFRTQGWQSLINDLLGSQSFKERNLINPEIALKQYQVHISGKKNLSREIWKWIHLELWFRAYID